MAKKEKSLPKQLIDGLKIWDIENAQKHVKTIAFEMLQKDMTADIVRMSIKTTRASRPAFGVTEGTKRRSAAVRVK